MRDPRVKTPLLLLAVLVLTSLTGTAFCEEDLNTESTSELGSTYRTESQEVISTPQPTTLKNVTAGAVESRQPELNADSIKGNSTDGDGSGEEPSEDPSYLYIVISVVLVLAILGTIICGCLISRHCKNKGKSPDQSKDDQYLDESSTEKVPMPMFEEDVPSVLELEMDELDQWMKKDC